MQLSEQWERRLLVMIVACYLLLAVGFSLGPIFEGPDEGQHYRYARWIAQTGTLPDPASVQRGEMHQAPLYYLLAAPIIALNGDADFEQVIGLKNAWAGYAFAVPGHDNKNGHLHPRNQSFPYIGSPVARAVHLIRMIGVLAGLGTVLASYHTAKLLWPERPEPGIAVAGFAAVMPQFLYMNSVVNNDGLLFLFSSLSLYYVIKQLRFGPSLRDAVLLGAALGGALLTKVSALFLVFPVGLAVLLQFRRWWKVAAVTLGVVAVIAGWWYLRNWLLYGDPTNLNALYVTWEGERISKHGLAFDMGLQRVPFAYSTFWARFGSGMVAMPGWVYQFYDALTAIVLIGLLVGAVRVAYRMKQGVRPDKLSIQQGLVIGVFALAWIGALVFHASSAWSGNQGRYLIPALTAWAVIFAVGLRNFVPAQGRLPLTLGGTAVLSTLAAIILLGYFHPSYQVKPVPTRIGHPLNYRFEDAAELIGVDTSALYASPGDTLSITLYWRALSTPGTELLTHIHSLDADMVQRDSYPGAGNLLAADWLPDQTWAETYILQIPEDTEPQRLYLLVGSLSEKDGGRSLNATLQGRDEVPVIARLSITGPLMPDQSEYMLGDSIGLVSSRIRLDDGAMRVCLEWQARAPITVDYKIFVHVLSGDGEILAQSDVQPKDGAYPTWAWVTGERVRDCIKFSNLALPDTGWVVKVGMYDAATGQRLPITTRDGAPVPEDTIEIPHD
jgi:4-amino-4-deoxy-L-arabinose transferase-like glycosyltransferase